MKVIFKKMVDAKYGQGAHLNINKTFKIASCPDCLKPQGSTCKFCLQAEPVTDITKGKEKTMGPSQDQQAPSDAITDVAALKKAAPGAPVPRSKLADVATANTGGSAAPSSGELPEAEGPEAIEEPTSSDKDLLFRCSQCKRAAHYSCISTPDPTDLWQYSWDWHCDDCKTWGPIDAILAWRPLDWGKERAEGVETPPPTSPKQVFVGSPGKRPPVMVNIPDHKATWWNAEYLVKFKETSFRQATWVPHSWLFSAYRQRLRNFLDKGPLIDITPDNATRDGEDDVLDDHLENFSLVPMPDALDLIPREWLTPDRILDVRLSRKHGGGPDPRVLNMKYRISDDPQETLSRVSEMYVKWQGLPYDAATWETGIPRPGEPMYDQFVKAYGEYLKFRNVEIPKPSQKELAILDRARPKSQFKELTEQPSFITLGKLMDFQLLGVSWLVSVLHLVAPVLVKRCY